MQAHDATPIVYRGFKRGFRGFKGVSFLLQLCVCIKYLSLGEPAMGSAAFLNEATTQLAEAYLSAKEILIER